MNRIPLWLALTLFVTLAVCCVRCSPPAPNERETAWGMAHAFVAKTLKAPSTAQFCDLDDRDGHCWKRNDGQWEARGWVDSQNGFGAMIRSEWHLVMMPLKNDKGEWLRVYYSFGGTPFGEYPKDTPAVAATTAAQ